MHKDYQLLFYLDADLHFLNHGSFGACPKPVFEQYQRWQSKLEEQPVLFLGRQYHDLIRQAIQPLAEYLGTSAPNLVFVPNATYGVNLIARSLNLRPGDEILTSDHEYGACDYTWEFVCSKKDAHYIRQSLPYPAVSDDKMLELFWKGVTSRTKLIFLSHITSPTALRLPVETICQRAHEQGILTLIDGAHAPGQIPLNLDQLGADFYTGNCHKWLLSPKGAGFLYADPSVQDLIEPLVVSWGFQTDPAKSSGSRFLDLLTWTGTHDPAAYLSVPTAIQFQQEHHWQQVQQDCHDLIKEYLPKFSELTGYPILYHYDDQYQQMACIEIPRMRNLELFKTQLYDLFQIEIPAIDWNHRHFLRISMQAYNQASDLDALQEALEYLIPMHGSEGIGKQ
ncbi:MAG: aminotransferase class V-fold PLP-dependent enzyme [Anaerolineaceae bacterium]|nr:aminotransferase class V-fold PLP-dependent enzyme [Anaerolineaceae bacterium]